MDTRSDARVRSRRPIAAEALDLSALVKCAAQGDERAWVALVERFSGLVWSVARAFRLSHADAADVSQTTWLRFAEHLGDIHEPQAVGAWLATTTRRECLRTLRKAGRTVPTDFDDDHLLSPDSTPEVDASLDAGRQWAALKRAVDDLPEPGRALLRVLMTDPAPSYLEAGKALGMPIGSIGPTRARALKRLRRNPELVGIIAAMGDSLP